MPDPVPTATDVTSLGTTSAEDRKALIEQLEAIKSLPKTFVGTHVYLDAEYAGAEKADFRRRYASIAARYGIDPPDVIIVKPPLDKNGEPLSPNSPTAQWRGGP